MLSAVNVTVQRGHLMLWAIFAPKFIFDATMQVVCGGAMVAMWGLVAASMQGWEWHRDGGGGKGGVNGAKGA
ncbi:unnamed protein product [Discosporangium mesarthrocarpum]